MQGYTAKSQASRLATLAIALAALLWGPVLLAQPGPPPVPPAVMVFVFEEGPFIDAISPGFSGHPAANDDFVDRGTETQIVTCVRAEHALRCHVEAQSVNTPWAGDGVCSVSQWEGDMTMQWQRGDRTWRAIVAGNRQELGTAGWTRVVTLQPLQAGRWRLRHAWLPTNGICEEPDVPRPGHLPWCRPLVMDLNQTDDFRQSGPETEPYHVVWTSTPMPQGCRRLHFGTEDHSRSGP